MSYLVRRILLAVAALSAPASTAFAQNYPEHVVRIVNPFPPGGSVDVTGRILAQKLSESLGGQFILENRAGAGGNLGAESVAKSAPDGYTLLYSTPGPLVVNHRLYAKGLPYDPTKDFEPIAVIVRVPMVLLVNPKVPANNVQELIELARKQPGKINFGSPGIGSANHLSGEWFKSMAKVDLTHVPYKGSGPATADLLGGHIQMMFDAIPTNQQNINAGAIRALANAGTTRPATLSHVPTIIEQGLPGFDSLSWFALVAPAKTPPPILARLRSETAKILAMPDVIKRLTELGTEPGTAVESEVRAFFQSETDKWSEVIRAAKISVQ
jgi:tripartite-type tricarboxylate transporter receptor subunit TctC